MLSNKLARENDGYLCSCQKRGYFTLTKLLNIFIVYMMFSWVMYGIVYVMMTVDMFIRKNWFYCIYIKYCFNAFYKSNINI